jgi:hypothetical protein
MLSLVKRCVYWRVIGNAFSVFMHIYKRNIAVKLFLFRLLFIATLSLCLYLFSHELGDYGFVLAFLLIICTVIPVTGLKIEEYSFTIRQYYCFGLLHRTWTFLKGDDISLQPFTLEVSDAGYLNTDTVWDFITAFYPTAKVTLKRFVIKSKDATGDLIQVKMKLSVEEQELIRRYFIN